MQKEITIIGAGLVGSLCSLYMLKRGYKVNVYERRSDLRSEIITAGKSINLALSERGWTALRKAGVEKEVQKIAIPVFKRVMHDINGQLTDQFYGNKGQAIYSVSRAEINVLMMDLAEKKGANLFFNEKCTDVDFNNSVATFTNNKSNKISKIYSDFIIGADGTFSAVRNQMVLKNKHNFEYDEIDCDYKELLIPAGKNKTYLIEKNALHIWPRKSFMLMALANLDGSFTCTLFAPKKGECSFENLSTEDAVLKYFERFFPDFVDLVPNIYEQWCINPTSRLGIVKTFPWHISDKAILIGDAAHATVPFYGQGMNCGFEDCRLFDELLNICDDDLTLAFKKYTELRKPSGDSVQELSLDNFIVMRDKTADPRFLLQKKIEKKFANLYPEKWIPLYSMVSFTNIPYDKALKVGKKQHEIMQVIMRDPNIEKKWENPEIMSKMFSLLNI